MKLGSLTFGLLYFNFNASGQSVAIDTLQAAHEKPADYKVTAPQVTLSSVQLNKGLLVTPEQLFAGAFPGLLVSPVSGAPGAAGQMRIRQGSSFAGANQPLVILNGVPLFHDPMTGVDNPLSFINLDDISSVTVLKDVSVTAMYGSRGSNGVILITTRKNDKPENGFMLSFSMTGAMATATGKIPVLSADEFRKVIGQQVGKEHEMALGPAQTDWQDEIYRTAYGADNQLNISGALGKLPYLVSVGYLNHNGVLKTSKLRRTSAAVNLQPSLFKDHLKLDLNLRSASVKTTFADEMAIVAAALFDPTKPVMDRNSYGNYFTYVDSGDRSYLAPFNPLSLLEQPEDLGTSNRNITSLSADYAFHFLPALHARLNVAVDHAENQRSFHAPANMAKYALTNGLNWKNKQTAENQFLEFSLGYSHKLEAINSSFNIMAGLNRQSWEERNLQEAHTNHYGRELKGAVGNSNTLELQSLFGRLSYTFGRRLELNTTLRNDGSSRFAEDNRNFLSRALGISWNAAGLGFTEKLPSLTTLIWRASYGILGKMDWSNERSDLLYVIQGGSIPAELKPASSTEYNVGLETGWFQNRLQVSVDVYNAIYDDLLLQVPVAYGSYSTGYELMNYGSYKTSGLEWSLNYNVLQKKDLVWQLGLSGAFENNEIRDLGETKSGAVAGNIAGGLGEIQIHRTGYPASSFYVYKQQYGPEGQLLPGKFADTNQDGFYTWADRFAYKSATPKAHGGFRSYVKYKRLDASILLHSQLGNYSYNNVAAVQGAFNMLDTYNDHFRNISQSALETELEELQPFSDYYVQDASFLRLEHLQLGYSIGTSKNNNPLLRIYATMQNAFTLTKYKGQEPGVAGGIDGYTYAQPRTFSFGLQMNLY